MAAGNKPPKKVSSHYLYDTGNPRQHRTNLHSTNQIKRPNKEVKRRAYVVGVFPNDASIILLIGTVLFEQNDEWQTASR